MGKEKNTIAINGQHYDTSTGEAVTVTVVKSARKTTPKTVVVTPAKPPVNIAPVVLHTPVTVKKPVMDVKRAGPKHAPVHQPQSGKTLMRKAVKKPVPVKSPIRSKSKPVHGTSIVISDTKAAPNTAKLKAAQAVPKSQLITHFSNSTVVPVANHPHAVKPLHPSKPAITALQAPVKTASMLDIKPRPVALPAEPKPLIPSSDIFQNALKQATAHEQPKHPLKHKKQRSMRGRLGMRLATTSLTLLLLAGFIGYQNMAQINMRLAAKEAGFAATLPEYKPSGFSLGAFTYSPGTVNVSYKSNSDQRSFAITQKVSNWDDQTLREEFVTTNGGDSYEVVQAEGQTIYVYGKKNATWVANGIWYTVENDGALSNHQLIELAASI